MTKSTQQVGGVKCPGEGQGRQSGVVEQQHVGVSGDVVLVANVWIAITVQQSKAAVES